MRIRLLASLMIFIGSYLPLSLILLAQNYDEGALSRPMCWAFWEDGCSLPLKNPTLSITVLATCVVCFLVTLLTLKIVKPKHEIVVTSASHVPTDLMNYTLPYIVSFMGLDYQEPGKFVGFLIFLMWVFFITHKSGQVLLNPVLIVFGWRLYDLTYRYGADTIDHTSRALSSEPIVTGDRLSQIAVEDVLVLKPNGSAT